MVWVACSSYEVVKPVFSSREEQGWLAAPSIGAPTWVPAGAGWLHHPLAACDPSGLLTTGSLLRRRSPTQRWGRLASWGPVWGTKTSVHERGTSYTVYTHRTPVHKGANYRYQRKRTKVLNMPRSQLTNLTSIPWCEGYVLTLQPHPVRGVPTLQPHPAKEVPTLQPNPEVCRCQMGCKLEWNTKDCAIKR